VLDLLGLSAPGSWQGRSLFDGSRPPRAYFYAANDDYLLGVREQQWKYIYNATVGREELFDLDHDGTEQTNLAGEHPDACRRLRQRVAAWMKYEEGHLAGLRRGPQSKRE
jgi:arylsulfatase A-like enzyme